jgi:hypothetical protein
VDEYYLAPFVFVKIRRKAFEVSGQKKLCHGGKNVKGKDCIF